MNKFQRIEEVLCVMDPLKMRANKPDWLQKLVYATWANLITRMDTNKAGEDRTAVCYKTLRQLECQDDVDLQPLGAALAQRIGLDKSIWPNSHWVYSKTKTLVKIQFELGFDESPTARMFHCVAGDGGERDYFEEELE